MVCHIEQSFCIKTLSYYPSYIISSVITQNNTEKNVRFSTVIIKWTNERSKDMNYEDTDI